MPHTEPVESIFEILKAPDQLQAPAVIFKDKTYSYQDVIDKAERVAVGLAKDWGVTKGDRVALLLPNCPQFVFALFAVMRLGAVAVPIGTRVRGEELEYLLRHSGAKVLISTSEAEGHDYAGNFERMWPRLPQLQEIFLVDHTLPPLGKPFTLLTASENGVDSLPPLSALRRLDDPCLILYTSGTTGKPKGVMLCPRNLLSTLGKINRKVRAQEGDRFLLVVPVTSSLGCVTTLLRGLLSRGAVVLMDKFKAAKVLDEVERNRISVKVGVPTMFILEFMQIDKDERSWDLSSLRQAFISGSECPPDVMRRVEEEMGCQVMIGYGLTESTSYVTVTNPDDPPETRQTTVGSPLPGEEVRIALENDAREGDPGEVLIRGNSVMMGYYQDPERTAHDIDPDGWFHTGDLGTFDAHGNLEFRGRRKDLIIRGGYNIYAAEIENFLLKHPKVGNASLVAIPDSVLGEVPVACIVPAEKADADPAEVLDYCRDGLTDYKIPDHVTFFESFPLTHNGKVRKLELKQQVLERIKPR